MYLLTCILHLYSLSVIEMDHLVDQAFPTHAHFHPFWIIKQLVFFNHLGKHDPNRIHVESAICYTLVSVSDKVRVFFQDVSIFLEDFFFYENCRTNLVIKNSYVKSQSSFFTCLTFLASFGFCLNIRKCTPILGRLFGVPHLCLSWCSVPLCLGEASPLEGKTLSDLS